MSTMYDFVDRQIFITSSASARAFVSRFLPPFLRASHFRVGCASGDRLGVCTAINSVRSRLACSTMIPPYRS